MYTEVVPVLLVSRATFEPVLFIVCISGEQEKDRELLRYKALVDSVTNTVDDITGDSKTANQRVSVFVNGRDIERACGHLHSSSFVRTLGLHVWLVGWLTGVSDLPHCCLELRETL